MPQLTVKFGDQVIQTHRFDGDVLRIGRSRENDIVLENLSVSRQHLQIRFHDGRYILTDMNSANGTLLNGVRVTKTDIVDEDVITLGKHRVIFISPPEASTVLDTQFSAGEPAPKESSSSGARFIVETGRLKGREFKITRFETSLGKAATNDVVITDDWLLGKKQAILLRKGNNQFEIQDLGGLRRVKINGRAVTEQADIKEGDLLELGSTKLRFYAGEEKPKAPKRVKPPTGQTEEGELSPSDLMAQDEPAVDVHSFDSNIDSLDLEDDYSSLQVKMAPAASEEAVQSEPEEQTPVKVEMPMTKPAPSLSNRKVFEDKKSTGRKKSRHEQSAPGKNGSVSKVPVGNGVSVPKKLEGGKSVDADQKEILMWEEALKSPSPAIRRQAARTLKQLTGNDYEA